MSDKVSKTTVFDHCVSADCEGCDGSGQGDCQAVRRPAPRDEPRIRRNLDDYYEAAEAYRVLSHRAAGYAETMRRALDNLRAAGGHVEAERLANG